MDQHHLPALTRALTRLPSRRDVLRRLAGGGLIALVGGPLGIASVAAKAKHGKNKRRKKHKRKGRNRTTAPDPITTADAACHPAMWQNLAGSRRFAQTFRALRSGQLTRASIGLTYNLEGAAFDLAIRELDPEGKPGYVLASTAISNVPATNLGEPPIDSSPARTISGGFAKPAKVVAGQAYAVTLTLTEEGTGGDGTRGPINMQASSGDPCPDGMVFTDREADGAFHPSTNWDLAVSTEVTA